MEETDQQTLPVQDKNHKHPAVIVIRDWKEYLGECLLIVFSVILALILTEYIDSLNEKQKAKEILHELKEELIENKRMEQEQYVYHLQILKNIHAALSDTSIANKFISHGEININVIAPQGVLLNDLNDVAWQIAKQNNIVSKMDISTYSLLNNIYNNQQRITNSEDKIGQILLSFDSRKPENLRTTLILLSDSYHGWDVDRAPRLIGLYQQAIDKLNTY